MRGRRPWTRSQTLHAFVDTVPTDVEVIALTGSKDTNTRSVLARDYMTALTERGVAAMFVEVANAGHNRVVRSPAFRDAVARLAGRR